MLVWDTETTGLVKPEATKIRDQPQIIEIAIIKLDDDTLEETGRYEQLFNPETPLPEIITKITRLTDADLKGKPTFGQCLDQIMDVFLGERTMVAHNIDFDRNLLKFELMRINKTLYFPWPRNHVDTIQAATPLFGRRMKMIELYMHFFKEGFAEAHRAMADTEALVKCVRELRKLGYI